LSGAQGTRRNIGAYSVLDLHRLVIAQAGGAEPVLGLRGIESAVAQPRATFDGRDLYPSLAEKRQPSAIRSS